MTTLIKETVKLVQVLTKLANLLLEQLKEEAELANREWPTDQ